MHIAVKELPEILQRALKSVDYNKKDINVQSRETTSVYCAGGQGRQGFAIIVNMASGDMRRMNGSWGGANMFNPNNAVDLCNESIALVENMAVITGAIGYPSTYASIDIAPTNFARLLPSGEQVELSETELKVLAIHRGIKSSYRRDEFRRAGIANVDEIINSLVARGFLSRNKNGAVAITTSGKNACANVRVW
jgi:hypothetical protein